MSGRSAYVRKKITETKPGETGALPRSRTKTSLSSDEATISDLHMPARQDTGVGTTNARFLKFSEPVRESEVLNPYRNDLSGFQPQQGSGGSQSGGSTDDRREAAGTPHLKGPMDEYAYARARKPVIKTEDVSGIEKSGLRSALDKKSEEVRKGIAKTFSFGKKKDKRDVDKTLEFRPQSSATVRAQPFYPNDADDAFDETVPAQFQQHQHHGQFQEQQQQQWDPSTMISPPPSAKLPPIPPPSNTPPIKRWIGAGRPVQRWNKLRKDPELWDPNGDVLVFFGHKGQSPRPNPSFRLSSHIIEATESRYLIMLLREGSTEEDILMSPSPVGAPPMLQRHGMGGMGHHMGHHHLGPHSALSRGQPTPPISEDASLAEADGQISYEMYFPTPSNMTKIDQLRHHITTRNVFALLYHASLVGLSLYQALSDLHTRLEAYMPQEADNVGTVLNYLSARGIDDVRNDAETAVSLLAWSEGSEVRWEEGWRESFLHCAGMYGRLESCADFKNVTPITRALLERACLETQLRVQAAEERLAEFQYTDMWPPAVASTASSSGPVTTSPAKASADRLQKFFLAHYTRVYGRWPPPAAPPNHHDGSFGNGGNGDEEMWLTRTVAQSIQKDFAALYDYLVNRDIVWDGSETRSSRKWLMVSESGNRGFDADTPDLPMTDMLIEFDNKLRFPHIPHPYPLVPESIPPPVNMSSGAKEKLSKKNKNGNDNGNSGVANRSGALERRVQLAYTEATNIYILGSDFTQSDLIDAFVKFEKADRTGEVDPSTARRGRWVLIYGVLQTLASVSVDAPNVRYREGVPYHLSPRLKGAKMPPWKAGGPNSLPLMGSTAGSAGADEAAHELSHCWTVVRTWNGGNASNSGAETSSGGSGNTSPVARAAGGYSFPRPPPTATSRSSMAGYHTPAGTRSVRSSSSMAPSVSGYAPFSSAGSVISESDTASSGGMRSPTSASVMSRRNTRSREGLHYSNSNKYSTGSRSVATFGPGREIERVDEVDWPVARSTYGGNGQGATATASAVGGNSGSVTGGGGFLVLDDVMDSRRGSFSTAVSGQERDRDRDRDKSAQRTGRSGGGGDRGYGRPLLSRSGSETDSVTPIIRDFDDLDVMDDHP